MKQLSCILIFKTILLLSSVSLASEFEYYNSIDFENKLPELYVKLTIKIIQATHVWDETVEFYQKQGIPLEPRVINPQLIISYSKPITYVVIASIGGEGRHSDEYSWIFIKINNSINLVVEELPYIVTEIEKNFSGFNFLGDLVINFCKICDGPTASPPSHLVTIPIRGSIRDKEVAVKFIGSNYTYMLIKRKMEHILKTEKYFNNEVINRINLAKKILSNSKTKWIY